MTTTTMRLSGQPIGRPTAVARRRRPTARPLIDLAPWIAPITWMITLAVLVAAVGAIAVFGSRVPSGASATISVRVAPSDTLWSIARANPTPGMSTAATVDAIARANGLDARPLAVGTVLRVPAITHSDASYAQAEMPTAAR